MSETPDALERYLLLIEEERDSRPAEAVLVDEIEKLRRWKEEALIVLDEWQSCYKLLEDAGYPAPLGRSKALYTAAHIKTLLAPEASWAAEQERRRQEHGGRDVSHGKLVT
jgi:hypothetical protein